MFHPDVVSKAREAFTHRHDPEDTRLDVLEKAYSELQKDQAADQSELREKFIPAFLIYEVVDEETAAQIKRLCDDCIITKEPTKHEIGVFHMDRHPVLDDATRINGDATRAEVIQESNLSSRIAPNQSGITLPPSETLTWNGLFDLTKPLKTTDYVRHFSKRHQFINHD